MDNTNRWLICLKKSYFLSMCMDLLLMRWVLNIHTCIEKRRLEYVITHLYSILLYVVIISLPRCFPHRCSKFGWITKNYCTSYIFFHVFVKILHELMSNERFWILVFSQFVKPRSLSQQKRAWDEWLEEKTIWPWRQT